MASGFNAVLVRTKADALDDPDPNSTPPAATEVVAPPTSIEGAGLSRSTRGAKLYLEFTAPVGQTATVRIWIRDGGRSGVWVGTTPRTLVAHRVAVVELEIDDSEWWPQLLDVTGGNPVSVYQEPA